MWIKDNYIVFVNIEKETICAMAEPVSAVDSHGLAALNFSDSLWLLGFYVGTLLPWLQLTSSCVPGIAQN